MIIRDSAIISLVVTIADHYNTNVATRFMRPFLTVILSESDISRLVGDMTEHSDQYESQGVHIDDLYEQIVAMSRFVYRVRMEVLPNLRTMAGPAVASDANRIYRDMAMNNFGANIKILAGYVNELHQKAIEFDRVKNGRGKPFFRDVPSLQEVPRFLGIKT